MHAAAFVYIINGAGLRTVFAFHLHRVDGHFSAVTYIYCSANACLHQCNNRKLLRMSSAANVQDEFCVSCTNTDPDICELSGENASLNNHISLIRE